MTEVYTPEYPEDFQFNPNGALWKVSRERVILLGGPTALLKQLAYPQVSEALHHTGNLESDPLRRLRGNAETGFDLIFGTAENNRVIYDMVNAQHANPDLKLQLSETVGKHQEGTHFSPRAQGGLGLVGATLIEGSIEGYQKFVGDLTNEEKDDYVREARELFKGMKTRDESIPETYDEVRQRLQEMLDKDELAVGTLARQLAPYTMLAHSPLRSLVMSYLRMVTFDMLPDKLRKQYGFKITRGQRKFVKRSAEGIKKAVPYMPDIVRYNAQYRRAQERLAHDSSPLWRR